jgi:hypothetical protein
MLHQYIPTLEDKSARRKLCKVANDRLLPTNSWCGKNSSFPMGCSRHIMGHGSGPYDRALLFPSARFIFCGIPKAGVTQWLQFLRFTIGAKDYQSYPYFKRDTHPFYLDRLLPRTQKDIWINYTKAVFIREPAERLLSAYLDKVANKSAAKGPFGSNVTFTEFIEILSSKNTTKLPQHRMFPGLTWYSDPHWRPQAWSCGLSEDVQQFNYIGSLDNAGHHTKTVLKQVGLWESHGKHYHVSKKGEKNGTASMTWPPPPLKRGEVAPGFQQEQVGHEIDPLQHNKGSKQKLNKYYTPELMEKVKKLYWMDFQLWNALQEAKGSGLVCGKDIVKLLNPACN